LYPEVLALGVEYGQLVWLRDVGPRYHIPAMLNVNSIQRIQTIYVIIDSVVTDIAPRYISDLIVPVSELGGRTQLRVVHAWVHFR